MAYTRTTWVSGDTPLSAGNMNNIEDGIEALNTDILDVIRTVTYDVTNHTIPAESFNYVSIPFTSPSGFGNPIVVNVRIDGSGTSSAVGQHYCFSYSAYQSGSNLIAYIRNTSSSQAKISVHITVLYVRTSL